VADENIGLFRGLWRFFTFWKLRKALGLVRAADRQFTGSVEGIRDAFDIHAERLKSQYHELRDAVAQMDGVLEETRMALEDLNKKEQDLLNKREGALTKYEAAQAAGNEQEMATHKAAFDRFDGDIQRIEAQQKEKESLIAAHQGRMGDFERQLTKLQAEVQKLPADKAAAIADFVSAKKIVELNDRLTGMQSSIDRGPIEAVLAHNRELTAKARVSTRLAGTDVQKQDEEYASVGQKTASSDRMAAMLAARKAEKEAATGAPSSKPEGEKKDMRAPL
jgi:chromosome segregation ATPase